MIHQQPDLARQYYYNYVNRNDADNTTKSIIEATFSATLPAFPNDNTMAKEYYERLMAWLINTKQVDDSKAASEVQVSTYWTNEVSW